MQAVAHATLARFRVAELAPRLPSTRLMYVADREADRLPLMLRAQQLDCSADWLVRIAHNRWLPNSEKLWQHTTQGEPLGDIEFTLPARPGGKARIVRQQLWARRIELNAGKRQVVTVTCIVAPEDGAPAGVKPIEWRLLTNPIATSAADVSELIDWYRAHWEIEMMFNVFKSGCRSKSSSLARLPASNAPWRCTLPSRGALLI